MNFEQEIATYLHHCEYHKKLSSKSIKAYSIDLKQFVQDVNLMPEQELTKSKISDYIYGLHQTCKPQTAKRKLASLRAFLNYLEFEELLEINPIRKIKTKFQESKILPKIIPLKLVEQLLTVVHQEKANAKTSFETFTTQRDSAIVEMLFATGMRVSELCYLKTDNVDLDDGIIRIMGKGTKERLIQIGNSEVLAVLRQYRNDNAERINKSDFFLLIDCLRIFQNSLCGLCFVDFQKKLVSNCISPPICFGTPSLRYC